MKNPLTGILPDKVRKCIYAAAFVASTAWGVYEAADGDWQKAVPLGIAALLGLTAASNTDVSEASNTDVSEASNTDVSEG